MKLRSITMGRLVSEPGYSNRSASVTIELEDGDTLVVASEAGAKALAKLVGEPTPSARVLSAVRSAKAELDDLQTLAHEDDDIPF